MTVFWLSFLGICWLAGLFLLWRIPRCRTGNDTGEPPATTIIIPARNEENRITDLLKSLEQQNFPKADTGSSHPDFEILVVDDSSTDNTANVAADYNVRVIPAGEKPVGWIGKSWACWVGAQIARFDLFVFLDADTTLVGRNSLSALIQTYLKQRGLLSVQPYHSVPSLREKLSAYFNIIVMAGLNAFTIWGRKMNPAGSFGPCLVCSRQDYFAAGGHEFVKHDVVEDVALGRRFIECGIPVSNYGGRHIISFRMYPGPFRELVEGWTKSMASGAAGTRPWIFSLIIVWLSGSTASIFLPFLATAFPSLPLYLVGPAIYLIHTIQLFWILRRIGSFGIITALLYPIPLIFFHIIFFYSFYLTTFKKSVKWRGRQVDLAKNKTVNGQERK